LLNGTCHLKAGVQIPRNAFPAELRAVCEDYQKRILAIQSARYDLEREVQVVDYKVGPMITRISTNTVESIVTSRSTS
jgi:hypothetical protein